MGAGKATVMTSGPSHEADKEQQDHGTQQGRDDVAAEGGGVKSEPGRQYIGYTRPQNADNNGAEEAKALTLHQQAGQPSSDGRASSVVSFGSHTSRQLCRSVYPCSRIIRK